MWNDRKLFERRYVEKNVPIPLHWPVTGYDSANFRNKWTSRVMATNRISRIGFFVFSLLGAPHLLVAQATAPTPVIFDTDMGNDVDDVLALAMLHAFESRGECKLLAVTITKDNPTAAPFVDAVNTFYGRGDIPIGVCRKSGVTKEDGAFNKVGLIKDEGAWRYPHDLLSGSDAPNAVSVLRQVLAQANDRSVVIVQVGFSTNLADLLDSSADAVSHLSGKELMNKKVKLVSLMAGAFEPIRNDEGKLSTHREYNVEQDVPSAQKLATQCEIPMVWSGFEIGLSLPYPHQSIEQDYRYVKHHPIAEAYIAYIPPPHDRPTWDLTSVLYAIRPERGYFEVSSPGTVTVDNQSVTIFTPSEKGKHRFLKLTPEMRAKSLEALVQLSSQPPHTK